MSIASDFAHGMGVHSKNTRTVYAPEGYGFIKGRGTMLSRFVSRTEGIEKVLKRECGRLGWHTKKIKVIELRPVDMPEKQAGAFFVNIGYLRGLHPDPLYQVLRSLPSACGHKKILAAIAKLPERVEALPSGQPNGGSSVSKEQRLATLARRAGYKSVEDLKTAIKQSRKAIADYELRKFQSNNLSGGVEGLVGAKPTDQRRHALPRVGENSAKSGYAERGSSAPPAQTLSRSHSDHSVNSVEKFLACAESGDREVPGGFYPDGSRVDLSVHSSARAFSTLDRSRRAA